MRRLKKNKKENPLSKEYAKLIDSSWFTKKDQFNKITIKSFDNKDINAYFHKEDSHLYLVFSHGYGGIPEERTKTVRFIQEKYNAKFKTKIK